MHKELLSVLLGHLAPARVSVLLVAPYMKVRILSRLLDEVDSKVKISVVTRWRVDDVCNGASDLDCYALTRNRPLTSFYLHEQLHAKYFRADSSVLIGSANLTASALGLGPNPNLEFATNVDPDWVFEADLLSACWTPSADYVSMFALACDARSEMLANIDQQTPHVVNPELDRESLWIPNLRWPEELFSIATTTDSDAFNATILAEAALDLEELRVLPNQSESQFREIVALILRRHPTFVRLSVFTSRQRRFGEVAQWLAREFPNDRRSSSERCQVVMRWVRYFLTEDYILSRGRYSELIKFVKT